MNAQVKFHQIYTLKAYFCWKYIKFQLKEARRSFVSWYQRVVENLKKNFFLFQNWQEYLVNFDLSTKKSKQFALWLVPFVQGIQRLTWKSTEDLYFMALKSHAKFEERQTYGLENDRNLTNFHQNTWKCQNWYIHGILLSKVENAWATNLQRSYK